MIDEAAVAEFNRMIAATGFTWAEAADAVRKLSDVMREAAQRWPIGRDAMAWSPPEDDSDWWTP